MERSIIGTAAITAALLAGLAWASHRAHTTDREALAALVDRVDRLAESAEEPREAPPLQGLERELSALGARLERLEQARSGPARDGRQEVPGAEPGPSAPAASAPESDAPETADPAMRAELDELVSAIARRGWDMGSGGDDFQRFLELARGTGLLDERLAELEEAVALAPHDVDARMDLADSYLAKLMTVSGPEQGLWGGRAEEQWQAVADLDDGHWRAHHSLGTNYSFYPEVLGKGPDAIRHLERTRELQRDLAPAPEHVSTYLYLARIYGRAGEVERAREVLEEGAQLHPTDTELQDALAALEDG